MAVFQVASLAGSTSSLGLLEVLAAVCASSRACYPPRLLFAQECDYRNDIGYLADPGRCWGALDVRVEFVEELWRHCTTVQLSLVFIALNHSTHVHISVATGPGLTLFTVTPYSCPSSVAQVRAKLSMHAFDAPYAVCIFHPAKVSNFPTYCKPCWSYLPWRLHFLCSRYVRPSSDTADFP